MKEQLSKNKVLFGALVTLMCAIPFAPIRIPFFGTSLSVTTLIAIVVGAFLLQYIRAQTIFTYRREIVLAAAFLFVLFCAATNTHTTHGWGILLEWFIVPALVSVSIFGAFSGNIKSMVRNFSYSFLILGGVLSVVSLWQIALGMFIYDGRFVGWWGSPNNLALFLGPLIPIVLYSAGKAKGGTQRYLSSLVLVLLAGILLLTQSIFGILSAVVVTSILLLFFTDFPRWFVKRKVLWGATGIIVLAFGTIFIIRGEQLFAQIERSSLASRVTIWKVSTDLLREQPLKGYQLGSFQEAYLARQPYYTPYLEWAAPSPHNLILALWFNGGIVALVTFLLLCVALTMRAVACYQRTHNSTPLFYLGALGVIILHGLFDTPLFGITTGYMFWLTVAGILLATKK